MGCRKNQASLSPAEKTAFVNAVLAMKQAPSIAGLTNRYDDFVQEHVDSMTGGNAWAHRRPAFLPWHREYLRRFELELQKHDPSVTLPYWNWTVDNLTTSSIWDANFMGGDGTGPNNRVETGPFAHAAGNWDINIHDPDGDGGFPFLRRQFTGHPAAPTLPTATQVDNCLLETPYDESPWNESNTLASFRNRLEGWFGAGSIHNRVHLWVGGNAVGTMYFAASPNDPVFWLHHCNIDRLWAQWIREHPAETYRPQGTPGDTGPVGHNLNDSMQPWGGTTTVASTLDHHAMGFWYDTDPPEVTLVTPSLAFVDVPEGVGGAGRTTYRAVVFEIHACASVTLEITAGPSGGFTTTLLGTSVVVPPAHGDPPAIGRIWIAYTSTNPGDVASGSVTIAQTGTANQWVIGLSANTIARPKAAVALALDRSGSMSSDAGDGTTKNEKLLEAVEVLVDTMLEGDGLAIVSYDDQIARLMDVTDVGPQPAVPGSGRALAAAILAGTDLDPRGLTAIGSAVVEAQDALNDAQAVAMPPYDVQSIVVLTDGIENVPPMIASVAGSITSPTYAIGLGIPSNISTGTLNALAQGTGRYLLVTGTLTQDQQFRLSKFFLQILAGISNAQIVVDPTGHLMFGPTHRIPFDVALADYGVDAILCSPFGPAIDFRLEAPDGTILGPALPVGGGQFVERRHVSYYRLPLPAGLAAAGRHGGRWHALLTLDDRRLKKLLASAERDRKELLRHLRTGTVPYNFLAHAYSTLRFEAAAVPSRVRPGERVSVSASLDEYGVPIENRASVWVDVTAPNGATRQVMLAEAEPGTFKGGVATHVPGLYVLRCRARGRTLSAIPFTREQALTVVAATSDADQPGGSNDVIDWLDDRDERLCRLLACILGNSKLEGLGVDPDVLRKCLAEYCGRRPARRPNERPLPPRAVAAQTPKVAKLVEAEPRPKDTLPMRHGKGEPMFGLSDADLAEWRAKGSPGGKPPRGGGSKGKGNKAAGTRRKR